MLRSAKPLNNANSSSSPAGGIPRSKTVQSLRNPPDKADQIQERLKKKSPWYQSILDPNSGADVKIPDSTGIETGTLQCVMIEQLPVTSDGYFGIKIDSPYPNKQGTGYVAHNFQKWTPNAGTPIWGNGATAGTSPLATDAALKAYAEGVRVVSASLAVWSESSLAFNSGEMVGFTNPWDIVSEPLEGTGANYDYYLNRYKSTIVPINNNKPVITRWFPVKMAGQRTQIFSGNNQTSADNIGLSYDTFYSPIAFDYTQDDGKTVLVPTAFPWWTLGVVGKTEPAARMMAKIVINYEFIPVSNSINILDARPSPQDATETDLVENWVQSMEPTVIASTKTVTRPPETASIQHGDEQTGFGMFAEVVKEILPFAMAFL